MYCVFFSSAFFLLFLFFFFFFPSSCSWFFALREFHSLYLWRVFHKQTARLSKRLLSSAQPYASAKRRSSPSGERLFNPQFFIWIRIDTRVTERGTSSSFANSFDCALLASAFPTRLLWRLFETFSDFSKTVSQKTALHDLRLRHGGLSEKRRSFSAVRLWFFSFFFCSPSLLFHFLCVMRGAAKLEFY